MSIREMLTKDKIGQQSDYSLFTDVYDDRDVSEILKSPTMRTVAEKYGTEYGAISALLGDATLAHYKAIPELRDVGDIKPAHRFNRAIVDRLLNEQDTEMLRMHTKGDLGASALCASNLSTLLMDWIHKEQEKNGDDSIASLSNALGELEDGKGNLEDIANRYNVPIPSGSGYGDTLPDGTPVSQTVTQAVGERLDTAIRERGQAIEKLALSASLKTRAQIESKIIESQVMTRAFGGEGKHLSLEEKVRIAEQIQSSRILAEIAKYLGKWRSIAIESKAKSYKVTPTSVTGITMGGDLARTLPSEFQHLLPLKGEMDDKVNRARQALFFSKFLARSLVNYEITQQEKEGKGSVVCLLDTSGSMSGTNDSFSKAISLVLFEMAKKDNRNFVFILFSGKNETIRYDFPMGEQDPKKLMDALTSFIGDGTDFETPLSIAMQVIEEDVYRDGDIVFITDGMASLDNDFLKDFNALRIRKDTKVLSVVLDCNSWHKDTITEFSDNVIRSSSLFSEENQERVVRALFSQI